MRFFVIVLLWIIPGLSLVAQTPEESTLLLKLDSLCSEQGRQSCIEEIKKQLIKSSSRELTFHLNELISDQYSHIGLYDSAIAHTLRNMELAETMNDARRLGNSYNAAGNLYYDVGNVNACIEYYSKALNVFDSLGLKKNISMAYTNLGAAYGISENLDKAIEMYQEAIKIKKEIHDTIGLGKVYVNYGLELIYQQKFNKALVYLHEALKILEPLNNDYINGIIYNNLGLGYYESNDPDRALKYYLKALNIFEKSNDKKPLSALYNNLGKIYVKQDDFNSALLFSRKSLKLARQINSLEEQRYALETHRNIFYQLGQLDSAYLYFEQVFDIHDSMLNQNTSEAIARLESRYENLKKEKELQEAQSMLDLRESQIHKKNILIFTSIGVVFLVVIFSHFLFENVKQKKAANKQLAEKNQLVELQNKNITSSIKYAKRIQQAILPSDRFIQENFQDSFIWYAPKDIVSGDFYWAEKIDNLLLFAVVDCTGHGVPGAFMSIVGYNGLNNIVNERNILNPGKILDELHEMVFETTHHNENKDIKDGMDIALCCLNTKTYEIEFAGAYNPLYIIRSQDKNKLANAIEREQNDSHSIYEFSADKQPVGSYKTNKSGNFTCHRAQLSQGDSLYIFSDGYADQFGGPSNKKFMTKNFRRYLLEIQSEPMTLQKEGLINKYNEWKGSNEQIDDICIIGYKIT